MTGHPPSTSPTPTTAFETPWPSNDAADHDLGVAGFGSTILSVVAGILEHMIDGGGLQGLSAMPPGPALAACLADLDPLQVPNDDIVEVLIARSRQLAHDQAALWQVMAEVLFRRPFARPGEVRRCDLPDLYGADEVRAALSWTRRAAEAETDLALVVVAQLPLVLHALLEGSIDRGKAVVFARHLPHLTAEQIAVICQVLLPLAPRLTTGQLQDRIKRMILEIDPDYYDARYRKALTDRRLVHYLDADGAAVVTATGLPAEEAAAAMRRVDDLARAARRAGHPGTLDQIRTDVFLVLLDGSVHGMGRDEIINALFDRYAGHAERAEGGPVRPTPDGPTPDGPAPDGPESAGPGSSGPGSSGSAGAGPGGDGSREDALVPVGSGTGGAVAGEAAAEDQRVGIEIRVPLLTLLGLAERAGELPGLGPVTATTARHTVARARRAQWRWAVVDPDGRLLTEGLTRRRPAHLDRHGPRGGIVELQITEDDLTGLADDLSACGPWATVVADIARQHARRRDPEHHTDLDAHPDDRFPRAALRRHVQIRDRTCTHPGCRAPATRADIDHTVDHARGGPTVADDLGPACRHDHTLKTSGGWACHQSEPGTFVWTSPLGRSYTVRSEPVLPPPVTTTPRTPDPWHDQPADDTGTPLIAEPGPPRAPPPADPPEDSHVLDPFTLDAAPPTGDTDPPPF